MNDTGKLSIAPNGTRQMSVKGVLMSKKKGRDSRRRRAHSRLSAGGVKLREAGPLI